MLNLQNNRPGLFNILNPISAAFNYLRALPKLYVYGEAAVRDFTGYVIKGEAMKMTRIYQISGEKIPHFIKLSSDIITDSGGNEWKFVSIIDAKGNIVNQENLESVLNLIREKIAFQQADHNFFADATIKIAEDITGFISNIDLNELSKALLASASGSLITYKREDESPQVTSAEEKLPENECVGENPCLSSE